MLPEEKLLHLIRKGTLAKTKNYLKKRKLLYPFMKLAVYCRSTIERIGVLRVGQICYVTSGIFLLVVFLYSPYTINRRLSKKLQAQSIFEYDIRSKKEKPLQAYLSNVRKNSIFDITPTQQAPLEQGAIDALNDISLVGIITEEPPQAIIFDKKTNQTYFLRENENLRGFVIVEIVEGKIVIEYRGELYEVYL